MPEQKYLKAVTKNPLLYIETVYETFRIPIFRTNDAAQPCGLVADKIRIVMGWQAGSFNDCPGSGQRYCNLRSIELSFSVRQ